MSEPAKEMPFEVPLHDRMLVRVPGKVPGTVLTIEQMIYTYRIVEYGPPLFPDLPEAQRFWCYEDFWAAAEGLSGWMLDPDATEPDGWVKATQMRPYQVRRARVVAGERVIVVDGQEDT